MSNTTTHPSRTRAYKKREMLLRALADAAQRAAELAEDDDEFDAIEDAIREARLSAIVRHRELADIERAAYIASKPHLRDLYSSALEEVAR